MYIINTRLYSIVSSLFWNGFLHFESGLYIYCGVDNSENIIIKAAYNELLSHEVEKTNYSNYLSSRVRRLMSNSQIHDFVTLRILPLYSTNRNVMQAWPIAMDDKIHPFSGSATSRKSSTARRIVSITNLKFSHCSIVLFAEQHEIGNFLLWHNVHAALTQQWCHKFFFMLYNKAGGQKFQLNLWQANNGDSRCFPYRWLPVTRVFYFHWMNSRHYSASAN